MTDLLDRRPAQLSGGQRQRVAIGRAMVRDPAVFLFDEPLSNLDAQLRTQMRLEIKKLHQRVGSTIVFVTHDQVEAMTLADRIVVMQGGRIRQVGTPAEVYHAPADTFVAQFIGAPSMNLLPGETVAKGVRIEGGSVIEMPAPPPGRAVHLGVRPEDLRPGDGHGMLEGPVTVAEPLGAETLLYVDVAGREVIASGPGRGAPRPRGRACASPPPPGALHLFDAETGKVIEMKAPPGTSLLRHVAGAPWRRAPEGLGRSAWRQTIEAARPGW